MPIKKITLEAVLAMKVPKTLPNVFKGEGAPVDGCHECGERRRKLGRCKVSRKEHCFKCCFGRIGDCGWVES